MTQQVMFYFCCVLSAILDIVRNSLQQQSCEKLVDTKGLENREKQLCYNENEKQLLSAILLTDNKSIFISILTFCIL